MESNFGQTFVVTELQDLVITSYSLGCRAYCLFEGLEYNPDNDAVEPLHLKLHTPLHAYFLEFMGLRPLIDILKRKGDKEEIDLVFDSIRLKIEEIAESATKVSDYVAKHYPNDEGAMKKFNEVYDLLLWKTHALFHIKKVNRAI